MNDAPSQPSGARGRTPPYISFKTLLTFLEDQKQHGLPNRIDRSVLTKFSGGVGSQLLAALKFAGLIDDESKSTPALAEAVDAFQTDEWTATLAKLVRRSYAPMVAHDLSTLTPAQFHELFKQNYPASDEVVRKCETFFITAANAAGISINKRITKFRSPRSSGSRRRSSNGSEAGTSSGAIAPDSGSANPPAQETPPSPPQTRGEYDVLIEILDPSKMDETEMAAVWTLIRYLKKKETGE